MWNWIWLCSTPAADIVDSESDALEVFAGAPLQGGTGGNGALVENAKQAASGQSTDTVLSQAGHVCICLCFFVRLCGY